MRPINPTLDESSDSSMIFLADLRGKLNEAVKKGRSYEDLADGTYVHPLTFKRFAEGLTKKPSSFTILRLTQALGFRLALLPADMPRIPGEVGYE